MISSIYNSNKILYKSGSRKNKSRIQISKEAALQKLSVNKSKLSKEINHIINQYCKKLNEWEIDFLTSIASFKKLSDKQNLILTEIKKKCGTI
jgi:hypothetical protein